MKRIQREAGEAAYSRWLKASRSGIKPGRTEVATAVRYTLQVMADLAPGGSVEVRVIPFGVTQVIAGSDHRRGTPPAVVEMQADTWLKLAGGHLTWAQAIDGGEVDASGERADLSGLLPLPLSC